METLDDIQLAISNLPGTDQARLIAWLKHYVQAGESSVREAVPIYGATAEVTAIQGAVQNLDPEQIRELRDWLHLIGEETPEMLAAIDEGIRSLNQEGGIVVRREDLEAKVRQWAGMLS